MHMPDRVLDPVIWVAADVAAVSLVGFTVRRVQKRLEPSDVPLMGVMAAFIFAAQMVNFPVAAGVSGHLVGAALAGILLGLGPAVLIMTTVLLVQCFLYQDGGVLALGANVINMALVGPAVGVGAYAALSRGVGTPSRRMAAAFAAAWAAVVAGALAVSAELVLSGYDWRLVIVPAVGWHALIGVGEGAVTVAALQLVWRTRPDLAPARGEVAA